MPSMAYTLGVKLLQIGHLKKFASLSETEQRKWLDAIDPFMISDPGPFIRNSCNIKKTEINEAICYEVRPLNVECDRAVIYAHGGAMFIEISFLHWIFIRRLAKSLKAAVYVPVYPLLPKYTYLDCKALFTTLYDQLSHCYTNQNICMVGDSSGAAICLALSQYIKSKKMPQPRNMVLISPLVNGRLDYPEEEIAALEDKDPILSRGLFKYLPQWWTDGDKDDFFIDPMSGGINDLSHITIITGDCDLLHLQAQDLHMQLKKENIEHNYIVGKDMIHVYPLLLCPEAKEAYDKIIEIIL